MIYSDHKLSRIGFLFGSRIILEVVMIEQVYRRAALEREDALLGDKHSLKYCFLMCTHSSKISTLLRVSPALFEKFK
ncbi:hypothetical protein CPA45_12685 [Vreelandella nigrificans]|uniref:Uncharacterized protein n=1 Tax=Vreelandella nigrificans TaxID=2042704 RepID=A0A2A4HKU0_9GAMM|nr:hypothetical protein CPA45_12685 [Halomonas nigrificans]